MSDEDIIKRISQETLRFSELQTIAKLLGIGLGKERSKEAICNILRQPANLLLLQSRLDLVPELRPDPKAIKAEAERKKAEADTKALRIQQKREALDTSTKVNRAMGFSFVALMFYILLIVVSTTDLQLFLPESPVRLPIVEVELPLLGFYSVVPFLILVFHFHLLINLKHHHDKYQEWRREAGNDANEASLDPILINFKDTYANWYHLLRILIVLVVSLSVLYFPLVNLTLIQWRFGDYHDFFISTVQTFTLLLDIGLIAIFFSKIGLNSAVRTRLARLICIGRSLPFICITIFGLGNWIVALKLLLMLENPMAMSCIPPSLIPTIDLANSRDLIDEVPDGYVLHFMRDSLDAQEARQMALAAFGKRMNLSGRDFRFANLNGLNLSNANMSGCRLDSANLSYAILEGVNLQGACLRKSNLMNVNLKGADMSEANLESAFMMHSNLREAKLNNVTLDGANMMGSNLSEVKSQTANMVGTNLQSAYLVGATLKNAIMINSILLGANLKDSDLHGANLEGANLFSAILNGANLSIVNLDGADLTGAIWDGANIEGTLFPE